MNCFKVITLAGTVALAVAASVAHANPLTLGASVIYDQSPYKSGKDRWWPVPIVDYETNNFYIHSLKGGYYLWNDPQDQLSLTLMGSPQSFDTSDVDDSDMKQLRKRHMTMMGGFSYRHNSDWGTVRTTVAGDILDNSNGFIWDLTYLYTLDFNRFTLTPGVGVLWNSNHQNNYYYGVNSAESQRSGLKRYDANDSWSPYVELTGAWKIDDNWNATLAGRYTRLASEIKDSPMVSKSSQVLLWSGISYTF